jgi:CRISPR type III-B/RAMP module RAMP protein Cmr1
MRHQINLSRHAVEDRELTFDWYAANYSVDFAWRWFNGITSAIESLSTNPFRCPKAVESHRFPFELYELLFGSKKTKHRILFTVRKDVVFIIRIRHSAQRELTDENLFD